MGEEMADTAQCNRVIAFAPMALLALLIVLQGGFFPLASCLIGIVCAFASLIILVARRKRIPTLAPVPLLLCLFALIYLASSVANTLTLTELSETGRWFTVASFAILCAAQTRGEREKAWNALTWLLIVASVVGIAMFCGLFAPNGTMHGGRLQFFLQYANSAALLFAAGAFLCLTGTKQQMHLAFLPVLALLATESAGMAAVFAVASVCYSAFLFRRRDYSRFLCAVLQFVTAVVLFLIMCKASMLVGFAATVIAAAAWTVATRGASDRSFESLRVASFVAVGLLVLAVAAVVLLNAGRLLQACSTFATRLAQMRAAVALFDQSPLLGVGPDNWQYLYPYVQDAAFRTKTVHNGYLQIAVDGGIVALAAFVVAAVIGLKNQLACRDTRSVMTAALILTHTAVDFDLRFTCVAALLVFALVSPLADAAQSGELRFSHSKVSATHAVAILLCLAMCCVGFWTSAATSKIEGYAREGEMQQVVQACITTPLASHDVHAQNLYLEALTELGEWRAITSFGQLNQPVGDVQVIAISKAYIAVGEPEAARELLESELEREPFNKTLRKNASAILEQL